MNSIKVSGKIIRKDKNKKDDRYLKLVLAMPLHMKSFDEGTFKQCYSYLSFTLFGIDKEQYDNLRKGNYVEIIGWILGNCKEDGTIKDNLIICPKTVTKGVR